MDSLIQELNLDPAAASPEAMDAAGDKLREKGFQGILLIAPEKVGLDMSPGLPLAGFDAYISTDRAGISFHYSAILVATRLESNETFAGTVLQVRDDESPPTPGPPPRRAEVMSIFTADARKQLEGLPWRPGTLSLAVLLFDKRSNQVRVALTPGRVADLDPAVATYLAGQKSGAAPAPDSIYPPLPPKDDSVKEPRYPSYQPGPEAPPIPEAPGIAMSVPRVEMYKPGAACVLRGSFRLPITPRMIVKRDGDGRPLTQVGDARATAVVPISLVVMANMMVGASVLPLKVPTYERVDPASGDAAASGSFAIDLFSLRGMPLTPQTYTIWPISGEIIGTPVTVAFVTPEMVVH